MVMSRCRSFKIVIEASSISTTLATSEPRPAAATAAAAPLQHVKQYRQYACLIPLATEEWQNK